MGYIGGVVKVSVCVFGIAGVEVLTEVRLIGVYGIADIAMDVGVVVVFRGVLDCRRGGKVGVRWRVIGSFGVWNG